MTNMKKESTQSVRTRPTLEVLNQPLLERIVAEAIDVLGKVGVYVENPDALAVLGDGGARIDNAAQRAFLPEDLIWRCVRSAPSAVTVFSRQGEPALQLEGFNVYFDPGSAAIKILDSQTGRARAPVTSDLVSFARLADALPHLERGGDQGGIAFFGNHSANGLLYELLDEDMKVVMDVTMETLLADWQENS